MAQAIGQRIGETPGSKLSAAAGLTIAGITFIALGAVWLSRQHLRNRAIPGVVIALGGGCFLAASCCFRRQTVPAQVQPAQVASPAAHPQVDDLAVIRAAVQHAEANPEDLIREVSRPLLQHYRQGRSAGEASLLLIRHIASNQELREQYLSMSSAGELLDSCVEVLLAINYFQEDWLQREQESLALLRDEVWRQHPDASPMAWRLANKLLDQSYEYWWHNEEETHDAVWAQNFVELLNITEPLWSVYPSHRPALLPMLRQWHQAVQDAIFESDVDYTERVVQCLVALTRAIQTHAPWAVPMFRLSLTLSVTTSSNTNRAIEQEPFLRDFIAECRA